MFIKFQKIIFFKLRPEEETGALKSMAEEVGFECMERHGKALRKGLHRLISYSDTFPSFYNFISHYVKTELWRNKNENRETAWRSLHE